MYWHYLLQQQCGMNLEYSMKVFLAPCFIIIILRNFTYFLHELGEAILCEWLILFILKKVMVNH